MMLKTWCAVLAMSAATMTTAIAQSDFPPSESAKEAPRLVEVMSMAQLEHLKLWYAGKAKNWDLAAYELRQLTNSLAEAAIYYPAIPVSNVTTMKEPLLSIADAIAAGDDRKFVASMRVLTNGCNACHSSMGRGFIAIVVPTGGQPPANQSFQPLEKTRRK